MAVIDTGGSTSGKVNVDAQYNAQVITPGYTSAGVARGGTDTESGAVSSFSEIDAGTKNGVRQTLSPECDLDYRLRVAQDNMLDQEFLPTRLRTPASIRSLLPRWPQPSERAVLPRTQARSPRPRPA